MLWVAVWSLCQVAPEGPELIQKLFALKMYTLWHCRRRKCKCLLQLGRVVAAQKAFDEAVDAIDRSGLKKDMRKGLAVDLQEAFIKLVKDEGDGNISDSGGEGGADDDAASPLPASLRTRTLPPWFELKARLIVHV